MNKIIHSIHQWTKKMFFTKNFLKYFITGIIFTILNALLVWVFVDFIVLFPEKYNTPIVTFLVVTFLFVLRYLVFDWIGFTSNEDSNKVLPSTEKVEETETLLKREEKI